MSVLLRQKSSRPYKAKKIDNKKGKWKHLSQIMAP